MNKTEWGRKVLRRMCEEPYRVFFPLGIFCGMLGIGHWLVYAIGVTGTYSGYLHASIQMQAYIICFIAGFLMTAMPRMSATAPASWVETCGLAGLILGVLCSLGFSNWLEANLLFVAALVWLLLFGIRRVKACHHQAMVKPPVEFVWVPIALVHGILGSVLLMAGASKVAGAWAILAGKPMVQQGVVLAIVLGVGGFLAPRLMGTFRVVKAAVGPCCEVKQVSVRRRGLFFHLLGGAVLLASFLAEGFGAARIAYGLRAVLVTVLMIWTRSLVLKPLMSDQYVRLLWLSLWMVCLGSWAAFIFLPYRAAMLHFVFIGGYSIMTFAVATMVITSHAGKAGQLKHRSNVLSFLAFALVSAACLRVASVFLAPWYFQLLGLSSFLWLAASSLWLLRMIPLIFTLPAEEEITRIHEEARKRVLRMRGS